MLAQTAQRFTAEIRVCREDTGDRANVKSILELLTLGAAPGQVLRFEAEGADSTEALAAIEELFTRRFGEED
jgi:phosphotransferase system HPr (HPr) family protein